MTTAAATATLVPTSDPHTKTKAKNRQRRASARTYISAALIVLWCLLPAYWMIVTAFRDVGFTFDTTPFFSHVTWDNFATAFSTDLGNHFGKALQTVSSLRALPPSSHYSSASSRHTPWPA